MESAMESEVKDWEYDVDEEGAMGLAYWEELNSNRWYIEAAAGRIKEGEVFTCFKEFDFCADCCQEFSQSTPRRKRNKCPRGECGEQPRYDVAAMVRTAFEDSEDEEGSDAEDEGQECGKGSSKKPPNQANKYCSIGVWTCSVENFENWMWFLHNLKISIAGLSSDEVFIVSDRQKGLEKAISEMLPENPHMHCGHHLKMNVQKHFGKVAVQVLQSLFHAPSEERFNSILEEAGNCLDCGREFVQYIRRTDPERFVRYALPLPRYGRTTSNSVEVMNGVLKPIRDFAPCRIAGQMWMYMLRLFCERREAANRSTERFTTFAKERLSEEETECGRFISISADQYHARVQTDGGLKQWIVRKEAKVECSCFETQDMLWPCIHFMSWLRSRGEDYTQYIDRIWFQKSLQQCYRLSVPAIIDTELPMRATCRAPPPAIRTGRARVVRIPNGGPSSRAPIAEFEYPVF
ncbi:hypothetical protein R1sor_000419 [Riccia sorocarpa]|uniref:SWIM-type domain-containing protein n=1 Tax=Riccia sorocarpa TaxID=122646 RepID=A0ABD3GT27_9MARC